MGGDRDRFRAGKVFSSDLRAGASDLALRRPVFGDLSLGGDRDHFRAGKVFSSDLRADASDLARRIPVFGGASAAESSFEPVADDASNSETLLGEADRDRLLTGLTGTALSPASPFEASDSARVTRRSGGASFSGRLRGDACV